MRTKQGERSLSRTAYEQIRNRILRGELPIGTPLSRRLLAREFGMSLLPVGEALQRLETEGLVESRPRVGTRVRVPTTEDILGHYCLREALEVQAARLFAERATPAQRKEILSHAAQLDKMNERSNRLQGRARVDSGYEEHSSHMRFHMRIAEYSGCSSLAEAVERNHTLLLNWHYSSAARMHRRLPKKWHQRLATALARGTVAQADRAMRLHVRYGIEHVIHGVEPPVAARPQRFRRGRSPAGPAG